MKRLFASLGLMASLCLGVSFATHAAEPLYSTEETPIGELLDEPQTKAVLEKLIPDFVKAERIDEARGMTLRGVQPYAADMLTDDVLSKIDAELAKVTPAANAAK